MLLMNWAVVHIRALRSVKADKRAHRNLGRWYRRRAMHAKTTIKSKQKQLYLLIINRREP